MTKQKPIKNIPVYHLEKLSGQSGNPDIFFNEHQISTADLVMNKPYRSNYFGIGVCTAGRAILKANLETYEVEKNCIVTISPPVIKQWTKMSAGYKTYAVFFTRDFLIKSSSNIFPDSFSFFEPDARNVVQLKEQQVTKILSLLQEIRQRLRSSHPYRIDIVRNLVTILLFETAVVYNEAGLPVPHKQTRSEQLVAEFKKSVCLHFRKERSVSFYARLLFVTPKHLTEIVKQETGRSAKEWIDELLILEAKVLLQDTSVTVAVVADSLNFTDQSVFGKFFKNITGQSPLTYRKKA